MKITLDIPNGTKAVSVCLVYDEPKWLEMKMASIMIDTPRLQDGRVYPVPDEEEQNGHV